MPIELAKTLASLLLILPAAFSAGSCFRYWVDEKDIVMRGVLYFALGLGVLSTGIIALSFLHLLRPPMVVAVLMSGIVCGWKRLGELPKWFREIGKVFEWKGKSTAARCLGFFFLTSLMALLMGTFSPEIGGDAIAYQLNLPKVFLRQGSLTPNPFDYNSYFPLLMNNLFLIGLAMGGIVTAKFFHFFCGLLLFLALWRLLLRETANHTLSLFISLAFWVTPTVYNLLSTCYVDVAVAFYSFLSLVTFVEALRHYRWRSFFLSGLLMGCAISIKYLALVSAAGIVAMALWHTAFQRKFRSLSIGLWIWGVGILLVSGGWLIRNWMATGNPFFPYFGSFFHLEHRPPTHFEIYGVGSGWHHFLLLFWNMFWQSSEFGSSTTRIGIFYFLALPFVARAVVRNLKSRTYAVYTLVFIGIWFFIAQADRWIIPIFPVMGLMGGLGVQDTFKSSGEVWKKRLRALVSVSAIGILGIYVLAGVYHYRYSYLLYAGRWTPSGYLEKLERTQSIADWVNRSLPPESKILLESEPRKFYFDREVVYDVFLQWATRYSERINTLEGLRDFYKSHGITHLLRSHPVNGNPDATPVTPAGRLAQSDYASELHTVHSKNSRDTQYLYQLYELK